MSDEEERSTALDRPLTSRSTFVDDVTAFKEARLYAFEIFGLRCKEQPDVDNVLARIEAGFHACAHYGQEDASQIEAAKAVAWEAFLNHSATKTTRRRTRP